MKGIANHSISSFSFLFVLKFGDGSMINKPFDSTIGGHPLDWGVGSRAVTKFMAGGVTVRQRGVVEEQQMDGVY